MPARTPRYNPPMAAAQSRTGPGEHRRLAANIPKLYAIRALFWMHFFASVLVPFFRDWGGISYQQIFLLNAWFMVWNFVLEIPTGTAADFFGRRVSLTIGPIVAAVAAVVYASTPAFGIFLIGELLFAIAFTLMSGADEALAWDTLRRLGSEGQARQVLARMESFKLIGLVAGALSGSWIAASFGLRTPLFLQAAPFLLSAWLAATLHEPPGEHGTAAKGAYGDMLREGLRYFRQHAALRALTVDMVGVSAMAWMIIWLYQPALEAAGIGLAWFGLVHAAMCLTQVAVLSRVGWMEQRLGSQLRYLRLSALLPGLGFLLLGAQNVPWLVVPTILVTAGFGLTRNVVFSAYIHRHVPSAHRATVLSAVSMVRMLTAAVANVTIGAIADRTISGALLAAGLITVALFLRGGATEEHL